MKLQKALLMTWFSDHDSPNSLHIYVKGVDQTVLSKMFRFGHQRLLRKEQMETNQGTLGQKEERASGLLLSIGPQTIRCEGSETSLHSQAGIPTVIILVD